MEFILDGRTKEIGLGLHFKRWKTEKGGKVSSHEKGEKSASASS